MEAKWIRNSSQAQILKTIILTKCSQESRQFHHECLASFVQKKKNKNAETESPNNAPVTYRSGKLCFDCSKMDFSAMDGHVWSLAQMKMAQLSVRSTGPSLLLKVETQTRIQRTWRRVTPAHLLNSGLHESCGGLAKAMQEKGWCGHRKRLHQHNCFTEDLQIILTISHSKPAALTSCYTSRPHVMHLIKTLPPKKSSCTENTHTGVCKSLHPPPLSSFYKSVKTQPL